MIHVIMIQQNQDIIIIIIVVYKKYCNIPIEFYFILQPMIYFIIYTIQNSKN